MLYYNVNYSVLPSVFNINYSGPIKMSIIVPHIVYYNVNYSASTYVLYY